MTITDDSHEEPAEEELDLADEDPEAAGRGLVNYPEIAKFLPFVFCRVAFKDCLFGSARS